VTDSRACARNRLRKARGVGRALQGAAVVAAWLAAGCASGTRLASPGVAERARAAATYSGSLRVSLRGPEFRGRARVLLGFRRPDAVRIEVPGPTGPRLVAVIRDGALAAVFPADRAFFRGRATPEDLAALLGVALAPDELIDLLVGVGSPRLRAYDVRWGPLLPREIDAVLPDGSRLKARVDDAEVGVPLPAAAFEAPAHEGFREIDAAGARRLWAGQ
jgi:hypothetical protein